MEKKRVVPLQESPSKTKLMVKKKKKKREKKKNICIGEDNLELGRFHKGKRTSRAN